MTPDEAIAAAQAGRVSPVYLVVGEERYLGELAIVALTRAALAGGLPDFNETKLVAGEADAAKILAAARVAPMMAKKRVVVVRGLERWDARAAGAAGEDASDSTEDERPETKTSALDELAAYAENPTPSTCLLLVAVKLDGRRKIVAAARKGGWLIGCEPLPRGALPGFITREAKARGHGISNETADLLAELAGPELPHVVDAIERAGLYAGAGQPITEAAITACVVRMRESTVWELLAAVGRRDLGAALTALADVYDPRDRGLRLLGVLAWSVRQLIKFEGAQAAGASPEEAARRAGAPPSRHGSSQPKSARSHAPSSRGG